MKASNVMFSQVLKNEKIYIPFLFLLSLLLLSSCVPFTDLPEGVWIIEDSTIVLYAIPEYNVRGLYPATQKIGSPNKRNSFSCR